MVTRTDPVKLNVTSGFLLIGVGIFLLIAAGLMFPLIFTSSEDSILFGWLLIAMTVVSFYPICRQIMFGKFILFSLPVWTIIEQWLRMGLLSIFYFESPYGYNQLTEIFTADGLRWFNLAAFYWTVSIPFLWMGYNSHLGQRLGRVRPLRRLIKYRPAVGIRLPAVFGVYLLISCIRIYLVMTKKYGMLIHLNEDSKQAMEGFQVFAFVAQYIEITGSLVACALLVHLVKFEKFQNFILFSLIGVIVTEIGFRILWGSKGLMIYLFISLAISYYMMTGKLVRFMLIGFFVLFSTIPINLAYREAISNNKVGGSALNIISGIVSLGGEKLGSLDKTVDSIKQGMFVAGEYSAQLQLLAAIIKYYDEGTGKHNYGEEWLKLPAIFAIPRFIWKGKPNYKYTGRWNLQKVWGRSDRTYSIAIPVQGDFYIHFGVWGMIGGMFFTGILHRILMERYWNSTDIYSLCMYQAIALFVGPGIILAGLIGMIRLLVFLHIMGRIMLIRAPELA